MKRLIFVLTVAVLFSSCSIFKKTTKKTDKKETSTIQKDVLTKMLEDIKITIPPEVWVDTYKYQPRVDTSKKPVDKNQPNPRVDKDTKPVTIEINRETRQQDSSKTETTREKETIDKSESKTESQGLFGFGGGFIIAIVIIAIGVIYFGIIR